MYIYLRIFYKKNLTQVFFITKLKTKFFLCSAQSSPGRLIQETPCELQRDKTKCNSTMAEPHRTCPGTKLYITVSRGGGLHQQKPQRGTNEKM